MDTEMTCYESFAEVTEDFYCSAVDVLRILVLRLHDYHLKRKNPPICLENAATSMRSPEGAVLFLQRVRP